MFLLGSHWRSLTRPLSTTTTTSGMVTEVSATFVATTILRFLSNTLNASRCSAGESAECSAQIACAFFLGAKRGCASSRSMSRVTSPMPGRNTRNAPSRGSVASMCANNASIKS